MIHLRQWFSRKVGSHSRGCFGNVVGGKRVEGAVNVTVIEGHQTAGPGVLTEALQHMAKYVAQRLALHLLLMPPGNSCR